MIASLLFSFNCVSNLCWLCKTGYVLSLFKLSYIPGLDKVLLRNDGFCYTLTASRHISGNKVSLFILQLMQLKCRHIGQLSMKGHFASIVFGFILNMNFVFCYCSM